MFAEGKNVCGWDDVTVHVAPFAFLGEDLHSVGVELRGDPECFLAPDPIQTEQLVGLLKGAAEAVRGLDRYHAQPDTPRVLPTVTILDRTFYIDERLGQMRAVDNAYDFIDLRPN